MRKAQKQQLLDIVLTLFDAHSIIKEYIEVDNPAAASQLMGECQTTAFQMGTIIEDSEGEGGVVVETLEEYCNELYQISIVGLTPSKAKNVYKRLNKRLIQVENAIKYKLRVRLEILFMPYKSSMWDAMESIWRAANADPDCDAYVVPIPYYDRKQNGSFGDQHFEGNLFPKDVSIISYQSYSLEKRRPDVIYIHNPYDHGNFVTSVDPKYYSYELKKYTDCLVYVPYYVLATPVGVEQNNLSVYSYADFIVTQGEEYRSSFSNEIPTQKLLPLGSPKLDCIIQMCSSEKTDVPAAWTEKMAGRHTYFYNTSIVGMLRDTAGVLQKMQYVFRCFAEREDACLVWRPHPLLESTFDSMRPQFKHIYMALKQQFLDNNIGVYDNTPDIERTISLCDGYIGDSGSSVIALFGVTGKPIFILDDRIHSAPQKNDWLGSVVHGFSVLGDPAWIVIQGNQLYHDADGCYSYRHVCTLPRYCGEWTYVGYTCTIGEQIFTCPVYEQEITKVEDGTVYTIPLRQVELKEASFRGIAACGDYVFMIPNRYPALVQYNAKTGEIRYFEERSDFFIQEFKGETRVCGFCTQGNTLYLSSPTSNQVLALDAVTGSQIIYTLAAEELCGIFGMESIGDELWLFPYTGTKVYVWKPSINDLREYDCAVAGLIGRNPITGNKCMERLFCNAATVGTDVYLSAAWGNFCVKLDRVTGKVEPYLPPFSMPDQIGPYFPPTVKCAFLREVQTGIWQMFSFWDGSVYEVDLKNYISHKIDITFDKDEFLNHEAGFANQGAWLKYVCMESAINSLSQFLDGNIAGAPYNPDLQIQIYRSIAVNSDGTCGEKIHTYITKHINP